jgi:UDP-glucose 4-epimerase
MPIFNGGSSPATVAEVVTQLFAALGAAAPEFSGGGRAGDPQKYLADIARARALGWQPRVELAEGLRQYVKWFEEEE